MDFRLFYYVKEIVFCPVAKNRAAALRCLAFVVREHKKGRGRVDWLPGFFFPQLHESMSQGKVSSWLWLLSHSCCLDTKSLQSWLSFEKGVPTIRRETFVTFSGVLSTFFLRDRISVPLSINVYHSGLSDQLARQRRYSKTSCYDQQLQWIVQCVSCCKDIFCSIKSSSLSLSLGVVRSSTSLSKALANKTQWAAALQKGSKHLDWQVLTTPPRIYKKD